MYSNFESKEELLLEVVDRLTPGLNLTRRRHCPRPASRSFSRSWRDALIRMSRSRSKELLFAFEFDALALRDAKVRAAVRRQSHGSDARRTIRSPPCSTRQLVDAAVGGADYIEALNAVATGLLFRRLVYGPPRVSDDDHPVDAVPPHSLTPIRRSDQAGDPGFVVAHERRGGRRA